MNNLTIFFGGAFAGALVTVLTMTFAFCFAYCAGRGGEEEKENSDDGEVVR